MHKDPRNSLQSIYFKKTNRASLSLIAALPNDGCYIQTFSVRQIPLMRYWVMMPNEACIRMLVALRSK